MKLINLIFLFLILIIITPAFSQDNADYFPYNKNNYWEYLWLESCCPDTIVSLSIFDTTDSEGRKIAIFDSYFINPIKPPVMLPDSGTYIIDSSFNVFTNAEPIGYNEYSLIYKLNGNQGDQWVIYNYSQIGGQGYEMGRIKEIYNDVVLGVPTKLMLIYYFYATDSTDTTGLGRGGDILAKGFGLQARQREGWPGIILKGAVIDGFLYGDTTVVSVERQQISVPSDFKLFQNYPNPFNPSTTIKYSLPEDDFVKIDVFNIIGEKIYSLVNQQQQAGNYDVDFDAKNLSSGIYLTRIKAGNFVKTIKMSLMK